MMGIFFTFLLGIANFAAQAAVFSSGHPVLAQLSPPARRLGRRLSLAVEFLLLLSALFAASRTLTGWVWLYGAYTLLNAGAAWAIAGRRI